MPRFMANRVEPLVQMDVRLLVKRAHSIEFIHSLGERGSLDGDPSYSRYVVTGCLIAAK